MFRLFSKEETVEDLKKESINRITGFLNAHSQDPDERLVHLKKFRDALLAANTYEAVFDSIPERMFSLFRENKAKSNLMLGFSTIVSRSPGFWDTEQTSMAILCDVSRSLYEKARKHLPESRKEKEAILTLDAHEGKEDEQSGHYYYFFEKNSKSFSSMDDWTRYGTPERKLYDETCNKIEAMKDAQTFSDILSTVDNIIKRFSDLIQQNSPKSHSTSSASSSTSEKSSSATSYTEKDRTVSGNLQKLTAAINQLEGIKRMVLEYAKKGNYRINDAPIEDEKTNEKSFLRRPGQ